MDLLVGLLKGVIIAWLLLGTRPRLRPSGHAPPTIKQKKGTETESPSEGPSVCVRCLSLQMELMKFQKQGIAYCESTIKERNRLQWIVTSLRPGHSPLCTYLLPMTVHPGAVGACNCSALKANPEEASEVGPCMIPS